MTTAGASEQESGGGRQPVSPVAGHSSPVVDPATAAELRLRLPPAHRDAASGTVKRGIVDLQNRMLAEIHDDPAGWSPDRAATGEVFAASVTALVDAAYVAGHEAAGQLTGGPGPEPATGPHLSPTPTSAPSWPSSSPMPPAGGRRRSRAQADPGVVSKAFRAWRMDGGERRLHAVSWSAYHRRRAVRDGDARGRGGDHSGRRPQLRLLLGTPPTFRTSSGPGTHRLDDATGALRVRGQHRARRRSP